MFCGQCGATVVENARFCGRCGAAQSEAPARVDTPPDPVAPALEATVVVDVRKLMDDPPSSEAPAEVAAPEEPNAPSEALEPRHETPGPVEPEQADETEGVVGGDLAAVVAPEPLAAPEASQPLEDIGSASEPTGFPRMAVLARLDGGPGSHAELDLTWEAQRWIAPSPGEEVVGRWMCLKAVCIAPTDQGMTTVFDAAGLWTLTDRRLVGLLADGKVSGQPIERGGALLVVLPLDEIDEVSMLRTRASRGLEERGVAFTTPRVILSLDLDRRVDESKRSHKEARMEGMRRIVGAVAAAKRPAAAPALAALLDRAESGDWGEEGDDLVALLSVTARGSEPLAGTHKDAPATPPEPASPTTGAPDPPAPVAPPTAAVVETAIAQPPDIESAPPPAPVGAMPPPTPPAPPRQIDLKLGKDVPVKESLRTVAFAAAGGCLLLLIVLLLPWQEYVYSPTGAFDQSRNGVHGIGVVVLLAAIALGLASLAVATRRQLPLSRRALGWSLIGGGALVVLTTFALFISTDEFAGTGWRTFGLLVALLAGALLALTGAPFAFLNDDEDELPVGDAVALARSRGIGSQRASAPATAPPGWYDDPERPGGKRWWDGAAWQMTDVEYHERADDES